MKIILKAIFVSVVVCFLACGGKQDIEVDLDRSPIVSVNGKTLYKSDVDEVLPKGVVGEDSVNAAQKYIRLWVDSELMYAKASENIVNKDQIKALVESYERSLIVNSYQEQLLKEQLSKNIPESELKSFYDQNPDRFLLDESIVKGLFLKVPVGSAQLNDFKKWYKQASEKAVENIEKNTLKGAVRYDYFYDKWLNFENVIDNIPFAVENNEQFLKNNRSYEMQDSSFVYLLNIKEYKLKGSPAPYEYVKVQLEDMFLEARKKDFMKQVSADLYQKAMTEKEIKFYE